MSEDEGSHELELRVSDGVRQTVYRWAIRVVPDKPHAPSASLIASPDSGLAPLQVAVQATATDTDGSVVLYELDADGDGTFELSSSQAPALTRSFAVPGVYRLQLRVTDDDSLTAVAERRVRVMANQPPRAELSASPDRGPAPLAVRVLGTGIDPESAPVLTELDADGDGRYDISHAGAIDTTLVFEDYTLPVTLALRVTDSAGATDIARATVTPLPDVDAAGSTLTQDGTARLPSDGKAARKLTVRAVDPRGKPLPGVEVAFASSRNGGSDGTVDRIQPARGTTGADGTLTAELSTTSSSTLLGDAVIRATAGGRELASAVTVQFVTPVNTFNSSLTCPFSAVHVRTSTSEPREARIVAQVRDAQNHVLPDMLVEIKTRDPLVWPATPPRGRSDANGEFRTTITSDLAGQNTFVDFYADGHKTSAMCVVSFIP
jgi:PKD repeat protein